MYLLNVGTFLNQVLFKYISHPVDRMLNGNPLISVTFFSFWQGRPGLNGAKGEKGDSDTRYPYNNRVQVDI